MDNVCNRRLFSIPSLGRTQFLKFGGSLRSQFLKFGGGFRTQFLIFGEDYAPSRSV